jgi:hypothetical protein
MLNYKIVDNFLPKKKFKELQKQILNHEFPWFYNHETAGPNENDGFYFTHLFYWHKAGESRHYNIVKPIIEKINPEFILRVKGNFYPRTHIIHEHNKHVDFHFKHNGFIIYINSNDGFTRLQDGTKINTIENRAIFFDSSIPHNSTTCTNSDGRINININYLK